MKKYTALIAAAVALVAAAPAAANEGRLDIRSGIIWVGGEEEFTTGAALGYDFDLNDKAFLGVEASGDKIFVDGADVAWGFTARGGVKLGDGKLFAAGGYTLVEGDDMPHIGAGYQHKITDSAFVKAEYRHFFGDFVDADAATAGIGIIF
jgi:hypothetical protein